MPKIRSRRWKTPAQAQPVQVKLPPLFVLPRDTGLVKIYGYVAAIECAYTVHRDLLQAKVGEQGGQVMAVYSCFELEKRVLDGKVGTNDPALFRKVFIEKFNDGYPDAREQLASGELVIDPNWSEQERLAVLYRCVEQVLASRN